MQISRLLAASVTPVVLISACGLITLALYNRLATILARLRSYHQLQIDLLREIDDANESAKSQFDALRSQVGQITRKARMVQRGLFCLLSSVIAFLGCSIFAAASEWIEYFGTAAIVMHLLGLLLFVTGIGWAMRELLISISPLDEEHAFIETAVANHILVRRDVGWEQEAVAKQA
jgi:hypothetical protein